MTLALAHIYTAQSIDILATEQAQAMHGADLRRALARDKLPQPQFHTIRAGRQHDALWQQFQVISELLQATDDSTTPVVLDITLGFRVQPFFAGATLGVLAAINELPAELSVVYSELDRDSQQSQIWKLDLFIELLQWSQALGLFMRTGLADPVVQLGRQVRARSARKAQQTGARFPTFNKLVTAIEAFADDLATVRIASLTTGYAQDKSTATRVQSSADRLLQAISACRQEVEQAMPPLAMVLDQLQQAIAPICADSLHGADGQRAMQALANHYLQLERYPEAAIVAREARISAYAQDTAATDVALSEYRQSERVATEHRCKKHETDYKSIAHIRNDIQHGGFREQPLDANTLKNRVCELVHNISQPPAHALPEQAADGRLILVSRHPGAQQWLQQQGIVPDQVSAHIDPNDLHDNDIVIGTLPMHIAAAVDARGIEFFNLVLEVPATMRGRELNSDELQQCKPALRRYRVQDVGAFPAARKQPA